MSERGERPESDDAGTTTDEGATPGTVGALDGAAAAGSLGAVGAEKPESELPHEAPDPSAGPD